MTKEFDIKKRTLAFSKDLLCFTRNLPKNEENQVLKRQLVRSGTSIGANVAESNGGHSSKDFANYMNIALKSANETIYWLELIQEFNQTKNEELTSLINEVDELRKIVAKISINTRVNNF